jgi:hypothetical protein
MNYVRIDGKYNTFVLYAERILCFFVSYTKHLMAILPIVLYRSDVKYQEISDGTFCSSRKYYYLCAQIYELI